MQLRSVIAEKRREREKQIIDLYLQCKQQNEIAAKIAEVTGLARDTVVEYLHGEFKQTITKPYKPC